MAGEKLIEYLPYIYHPKMDSENEQSSHQVKTRRFVLENKHKYQIKSNHFSTHISLPTSAILFRKLWRLFQISRGRDDRASKSGRRPIERTGIVLPILAALLLAQTNRLLEKLEIRELLRPKPTPTGIVVYLYTSNLLF